MTKFSEVLAAGITIRESADDGSDFTNPTADYRRLFLGEDGDLHLKDSSGTVTDIGGGGGTNPGATLQKVTRTAGSLTLTGSVTTMAEISSTLRLTIAAAAGDVLMAGCSGLVTAGANGECAIDFATMTSPPTIVNRFNGGGTRVGLWASIAAGATGPIGATASYVVQAGDISGGNVIVSPSYIQAGAGNGTLLGTTTYAFSFYVFNMKQ